MIYIFGDQFGTYVQNGLLGGTVEVWDLTGDHCGWETMMAWDGGGNDEKTFRLYFEDMVD